MDAISDFDAVSNWSIFGVAVEREPSKPTDEDSAHFANVIASSMTRQGLSLSGRNIHLKGSASAEVGINFSSDGKGGTKVEGYGKAEVRDDNGNYVKAEAKKDSDGNTSGGVSAGHKEENKK